MFNNMRGLTFDDVLLVPGYNGIKSRQMVTTGVKVKNLDLEIPIVSSNMDTITGVAMANMMSDVGGMAILHRFMSVEENVAMLDQIPNKNSVGFSIGIGVQGLERAEAMCGAGLQICCVDVAHGHSKEVNRTIRALRERYSDNIVIIAGNVATYAGADYLAAAGADIIKVGIGSGSVCTTRIKTGYGVPQLTAIMECSRVDRPMIADGGVRYPADVVKALAAGADLVMLGGMLSGTEETPGKIIERMEDGKPLRFKQFRGMASLEAQVDYMGGMSEWKTAEGIALEVPCKGSAKAIIQDVIGGLRSGMTYCGAATIEDLQRRAQFLEVTQASKVEGTPHAIERYIK